MVLLILFQNFYNYNYNDNGLKQLQCINLKIKLNLIKLFVKWRFFIFAIFLNAAIFKTNWLVFRSDAYSAACVKCDQCLIDCHRVLSALFVCTTHYRVIVVVVPACMECLKYVRTYVV